MKINGTSLRKWGLKMTDAPERIWYDKVGYVSTSQDKHLVEPTEYVRVDKLEELKDENEYLSNIANDMVGEIRSLEQRAEAAEKERDEAKAANNRMIAYSSDLQRIIEDLCQGGPIREPETTARYHYDMAVASAERQSGALVKVIPHDNDGIEQDAFEEWAEAEGYDTQQHPLHFLFLNARTDAAREGWRAGLRHAHDRIMSALSAEATDNAGGGE